MNMSGEIRVKTDKKYKNLYNDLKNFAVGDMHELFFLCACLGFREDKKMPLDSNGEDRFWSKTITPDEYACYYAMVLEKNGMDLSTIKDDKLVIAEIEKYANAGMESLISECLSDYLVKKDLKLDPTTSRELPKVLLFYINEKLNKDGMK